MKKILLTVASLMYFAISVQATSYVHDCAEFFVAYSGDQHPTEETNFPCEDPKQCKLATRHKFGEASVKPSRAVSFLVLWVFAGTPPGEILEDRRVRSLVSAPPAIQGISLFILHRVFRL